MTCELTPSTDTQGATRPFRELLNVARHYLDMLYTCDPGQVDSIFHESARLCTLESGRPVFRTVSEYKDVLRSRIPPSSNNASRDEQLVTLDLSSPSQALIKLKVRINELVFIDYLTLAKVGPDWRIVSKTYHRLEA